jgi:endoglucanase
MNQTWYWLLRGAALLQVGVPAYVYLPQRSPIAPTPTCAPAALPTELPRGYLRTSGHFIVDSHNCIVRIAAVNWYGMEYRYFVPAGLDRAPLQSIVNRIRDLGFNTIRLPFSNELVEHNPVVHRKLTLNPSLNRLHALAVMDHIVAAATRAGVKIILDDQRSNGSSSFQHTGLWYTGRFGYGSWLRDWVHLAARYKGNSTVIGFDLRNEPHTAPPGPWTLSAYLKQGAVWGPFDGVDNKRSDWRLAAERAGDAVLQANPRLLIFVEGIQLYPDDSAPHGIDSYWWGGNLRGASLYPVRLSMAHRLVYSAHEYGPSQYAMPFFTRHTSYQQFVHVLDVHWVFLERTGVPVFLGEFNTCGYGMKCTTDSGPGTQGRWFTFLCRFLRRHREIGWAYWAMNGSRQNDGRAPRGLLQPDWFHVREHSLLEALQGIAFHAG